jgi:hypothetical protein
VVRSNHNEELGIISFKLFFFILQCQKEEEGRHKKEEVSQLRLREYVGRHSLGIYSMDFCRVFAYAVIHTNRHTSLDLRFGAIQCVGII